MQVKDKFKEVIEFSELCDRAESNASSGWENEFIHGIIDRFNKYGATMFISDKQLAIIERLANKEI